MVVPGTWLLNSNLLVIAYLVALGYLFIGIAIISDIFMEAIEAITAQTKRIELWDKEGKTKLFVDVPIWNATVANLTLMALGSSAPEILLSVIGTVQDIEAIPSKLGPSTIVGSAAFNLLVISGLSIVAVGDEPKKVFDVGVFAVTSIASMFAYIWLYLTLQEFSACEVETWEAWLTLSFFFFLIGFAYAADKINAYFQDKKKTESQKLEEERKDFIKMSKNNLRNIAKEKGQDIVIEVAQGVHVNDAVSEQKQREIKNLFKEILEKDDLSNVTPAEFLACLQPDSLLERFAYRHQGAINHNKDFIMLKGHKGQVEMQKDGDNKIVNGNDMIGFKCLHYSVTESNGHVELTVIKKVPQVLRFGYRTVSDTAVSPKDYQHTE